MESKTAEWENMDVKFINCQTNKNKVFASNYSSYEFVS